MHPSGQLVADVVGDAGRGKVPLLRLPEDGEMTCGGAAVPRGYRTGVRKIRDFPICPVFEWVGGQPRLARHLRGKRLPLAGGAGGDL